VTAIHGRDYVQSRETSPLAQVIVFGLASFAFALFPAPIEAVLSLIFPAYGATLAAVLTWGLVALWIAYVIRLAITGRLGHSGQEHRTV
jgi:uncharacterized membrane protein